MIAMIYMKNGGLIVRRFSFIGRSKRVNSVLISCYCMTAISQEDTETDTFRKIIVMPKKM